ncbi:hypothetical protein HRbin12_01469 [bacterium HR12]|nr:hypothetical protein HRbin12_01469 [bacterium HR12]
MTPSGSFHGSKRETCTMMGLAGSIPYAARTSTIVSGLTGRFFTERGSMDGGMKASRGPSMPGRANSGRVKIAASYRFTRGSKKLQTGSWGAERSMWHRQIQVPERRPCSSSTRSTAAGWGSWTR